MKLNRAKCYGDDISVEKATADYIDQLLVEYEPFLFDEKENFLDRLNSCDYNIHLAAFWEMYLVFYLRNSGFRVLNAQERRSYGETRNSRRPDIRILHEGKTVWIEAVCLTAGQGEKLNEFLNPPDSECEWVGAPEDEILLRYTTAIDNKQRAFQEYPCVKNEDVRVIAINTGMIWRGGFCGADDVPKVAKVLFGIGSPYITISLEQDDFTKSGYTRRKNIPKNSSEVPSSFFIDDSCKHISAILASDAMPRSVANRGLYDKMHWVLARNPKALVSIDNCFTEFQPDVRFRGDDGQDYIRFAPLRLCDSNLILPNSKQDSKP